MHIRPPESLFLDKARYLPRSDADLFAASASSCQQCVNEQLPCSQDRSVGRQFSTQAVERSAPPSASAPVSSLPPGQGRPAANSACSAPRALLSTATRTVWPRCCRPASMQGAAYAPAAAAPNLPSAGRTPTSLRHCAAITATAFKCRFWHYCAAMAALQMSSRHMGGGRLATGDAAPEVSMPGLGAAGTTQSTTQRQKGQRGVLSGVASHTCVQNPEDLKIYNHSLCLISLSALTRTSCQRRVAVGPRPRRTFSKPDQQRIDNRMQAASAECIPGDSIEHDVGTESAPRAGSRRRTDGHIDGWPPPAAHRNRCRTRRPPRLPPTAPCRRHRITLTRTHIIIPQRLDRSRADQHASMSITRHMALVSSCPEVGSVLGILGILNPDRNSSREAHLARPVEARRTRN